MKKNIKDLIRNREIKISFLIVSFVFLLTAFLRGFIYEILDDIWIEEALRGFYWETPITNHPVFFRAISHLYVLLYRYFNYGINFFGWSLLLTNFVSYLIIVFFLIKKENIKFSFVLVLIFLFASYQNVYLINSTRISIITAFAGFLLSEYILFDSNHKKTKFFLFIISSFLILISCIFRFQGTLLALLLYMPFIFLHLYRNNFRVKSYWIFLVFMPLILFYFIDNSFLKKIEPVPETKHLVKLIDYNMTFSPKNKEQEKLLFESKNWFLTDSETMKLIEYENEFVNNGKDYLLLKEKNFIKLADRILWKFKKYCSEFPLLILLLFLSLLNAFSFIAIRFKESILLIFFSLCCFFLWLYIFLFMKLENRVIIPFFSIWLFNLLFILTDLYQLYKRKIHKYFLIFSIFLILICLPFQFISIRKDLDKRYYRAILSSEMQQRYYMANKVDYIFLTLAHHGYNYFATRQSPQKNTAVQIPIFGWLPLLEPDNYLFRLTGSNNVKGLFEWMADNAETTYLYSDVEWNLILEEIFEYNGFSGRIVPDLIFDEKTKEGFYKIERY
ncbi:MAG: hypothetical protein PHT69_00315 [Bacteroidales bacterium]|nr:hypothetical protein [Bacteroidales bacterium]